MPQRFVDGIYSKKIIKSKPKEPFTRDKKHWFQFEVKKIKRSLFLLWRIFKYLSVILFILIILTLLLGFWFWWKGWWGPKADFLRIVSGLNGKYLVLFQNNTELRPSGGFLGSLAEVEISRGTVKNYYFNTNVYKTNKELSNKICLSNPLPFKEAWPQTAPCLSFVNSNWAADFQKAAKDVEWFYQQSRPVNFNGIIAIDTQPVIDFLKLTGPITLPQYNLRVTAENFTKEIQYQVEIAYWEKEENRLINEPKTILKDMVPEILSRSKNHHLWPVLLKLILKNLNEKHILLYLKDPSLNQIVLENNWGGVIKETEKDYFYLNNANIGGWKSSQNIKEEVVLKSQVNIDNTIDNTLIYRRSHRGTGEWPDANNRNYTRVYLPRGSILQKVQGIDKIDVSNEFNKTVFGFWSSVKVGESKTFVITYRLPFKKSAEHSLLIQKQSGAPPIEFCYYYQENKLWKWQNTVNSDKLIRINFDKNREKI